LINNRQAGRRRGRGGGNGGGNNGGGGGGPRQGRPDNGNRIDSRARGNAAQLLEKYRNLAADAQRQGDRVNTEYYHQFADHYFRVLSEQRGRFEEQPRRTRDDFDGDDDFGDEGEPIRQGEQQMEARDRPERQERQDRPERQERPERRPDRGERFDRGERPVRADRDGPRAGAEEAPVAVGGQHRADPIEPGESLGERAEAVLEADAPLAPRRRGRPRRAPVQDGARDGVQDGDDGAGAMPAALDADRLPPSLMTAANDAGAAEDAPKPRRRRARPAAAETPDAAE